MKKFYVLTIAFLAMLSGLSAQNCDSLVGVSLVDSVTTTTNSAVVYTRNSITDTASFFVEYGKATVGFTNVSTQHLAPQGLDTINIHLLALEANTTYFLKTHFLGSSLESETATFATLSVPLFPTIDSVRIDSVSIVEISSVRIHMHYYNAVGDSLFYYRYNYGVNVNDNNTGPRHVTAGTDTTSLLITGLLPGTTYQLDVLFYYPVVLTSPVVTFTTELIIDNIQQKSESAVMSLRA